MRMEYIYESPDNGKTIFRRPFGSYDSKRELVNPLDDEDDTSNDCEVIILEDIRRNKGGNKNV
jgi:hypothetical protein